MKFKAEIKEVKSRKLITNDIEYSLKLTTSDPQILGLGAIPADEILDVDIALKGGL